MKLRRSLQKAVRKAFDIVDDAVAEVNWTFRQAFAASYDPITDTVDAGAERTKTLKILVYDQLDKDNLTNFSSTGLYVDAPAKLETASVLIPYMLLDGNTPSNRDTITWGSVRFSVDVIEYIPTAAAYLGTIRRTR
jgi:hypothetical protein